MMRELRYIAKTESIVLYNDNYYFVPVDMNYLFKMSKDLISLELLVRLNENTIDSLYSEIVGYADKLFLIPKMANKIAVYDLLKEEIEYFYLDDKNVDRKKGSMFLSSVIFDDCLYCIPTNYTRIVCINMRTIDIKEIPIANGGMICNGIACVKNGKIWIPNYDENNVVVYDIQNQSVEYLFSEKMDYHYNIAMDCGQYVLLQSFDLQAPTIQYFWETKTSTIVPSMIGRNWKAWKGIIINGNLYLITTEPGRVVKISKKTEVEFLPINTFITAFEKSEQWENNRRQIYILERNNRIYLVNGVTAEWYSYDGKEWQRETVYGDIKCNNCIRLDYGILPLL